MAFFVLLLLLLLLPNLLLAIRCNYSAASTIAGIALPAAIYLMIGASVRFSGGVALLMVGVVALCAFQIVLIHLFGGVTIAADMFMNLSTTNSGEAGELLGNITGVLAIILLIYASLLVVAWLATRSRLRISLPMRKRLSKVAVLLLAVGIVALLVANINSPHSILLREVFPVNAICNLRASVDTHLRLRRYGRSSSEFRFDAERSHPPRGRELYIYIIGEASRRASWGLFGYERNTTPCLSRRDDITLLEEVVTQSNTTHKSVPLLLSGVGASEYAELYRRKGICSLFGEAGFRTYFISNQQRQGAMVDYLAAEADSTLYLGSGRYDDVLLSALRSLLREDEPSPTFVVLHCYGSHYDYRERYPADFSRWVPDGKGELKFSREAIRNSYDNSVLYTDHILSSIIAYAESLDCCAAILYCSDHGEDLYDDHRERFLHSSPTLSRYQLQVPAFVWLSKRYTEAYPDKAATIERNRRYGSTTRSMFHTIAEIAHIESMHIDTEASFAGRNFDTAQRRHYLDDYNEAVPLTDARLGLNEEDMEALGIDQKQEKRL
ncbi:MAG: sulfatase-like hydrolase/transferase [Alistipes sp.]|nr:sulfatase-like hydrolase/transferase [Alistipes sp.]